MLWKEEGESDLAEMRSEHFSVAANHSGGKQLYQPPLIWAIAQPQAPAVPLHPLSVGKRLSHTCEGPELRTPVPGQTEI